MKSRRQLFVEAEMEQLQLGNQPKTPEQEAYEEEQMRKRIRKHDAFWGVKWGSTISPMDDTDRDD